MLSLKQALTYASCATRVLVSHVNDRAVPKIHIHPMFLGTDRMVLFCYGKDRICYRSKCHRRGKDRICYRSSCHRRRWLAPGLSFGFGDKGVVSSLDWVKDACIGA
jgi:hypothetical protein